MTAFYGLLGFDGLVLAVGAALVRGNRLRGSVGPETPKTEQARKQGGAS